MKVYGFFENCFTGCEKESAGNNTAKRMNKLFLMRFYDF